MAFTSGDGSETDNQSDNSFLIVEFNEKKKHSSINVFRLSAERSPKENMSIQQKVIM